MANYRLILASASPRRKELLQQIGVSFEVIPSKGEENITSSQPFQAVQELSFQKAAEVAQDLGRHPACSDSVGRRISQPDGVAPQITLVLGADTLVAYAGRILGKPKDKEDAKAMLRMLSGSTHSVFTGVTLLVLEDGKEMKVSFYEETKVTMYSLSEQQIAAYVETGEPMDKAGAYGIQGRGAVLVQGIQGDYNNVVGLPVARINQELIKSGIEIF